MRRIVLDHGRKDRAERDLYKKVLRQIASHKRHTLEQRLADAALTFWKEVLEERQNAEAHGRAVARTVQPLVGPSESRDK